MGHSPIYPPSVQTGQAFQIMLSGEHLLLEPAHRVGACCPSFKASPSNDDAHSWVLGQPFSVVGVLIAGKTAVYRLPEQSHQLVLDVAATPALLQTSGCCLRQSQGIIQLVAGQESGVRIDAVEWAVEKGIAESDHVAILGASYGGYAVLVGLTFTPGVFVCGVDLVGISNLNTFNGQCAALLDACQVVS